MRAWVIVVLLVIIGIVGAWVGYWVGHAAGWTTNAEFPNRIGGGDLAILLSILFSFASVMGGIGWLVARPLMSIRRLLAAGRPGHATILKAWRTGLTLRPWSEPSQHELRFELEVHPDSGGDYYADALGLIADSDEAALKPGAEVAIRYDPANRARVVVERPLATPTG